MPPGALARKISARNSQMLFGRIVSSGDWDAATAVPPATAQDGQFWKATSAGTYGGATIPNGALCLFSENLTVVHYLVQEAGAGGAGGSVILGDVNISIPTDYPTFAAAKAVLLANSYSGLVTVNIESAALLENYLDFSGIHMPNLDITTDGAVSLDSTAFPLLGGVYRALIIGVDFHIGSVSGEFVQTAGPTCFPILAINGEYTVGKSKPLGGSKTLTVSGFAGNWSHLSNVTVHGQQRLFVNNGATPAVQLTGQVFNLDLETDAAIVSITACGSASFSRMALTGAEARVTASATDLDIKSLVVPASGVFSLISVDNAAIRFASAYSGPLTPQFNDRVFHATDTASIRGSVNSYVFTPTSANHSLIGGSDQGRVELRAGSGSVDTGVATPYRLIASASFHLDGAPPFTLPYFPLTSVPGVNSAETGALRAINTSQTIDAGANVTGSTVTLPWLISHYQHTGAAVAALTFDLQYSELTTISVGSEGGVAALTISPAPANTAPSAIAAGESLTFRRSPGTPTWYYVGR